MRFRRDEKTPLNRLERPPGNQSEERRPFSSSDPLLAGFPEQQELLTEQRESTELRVSLMGTEPGQKLQAGEAIIQSRLPIYDRKSAL
jgi:hypothetical protein